MWIHFANYFNVLLWAAMGTAFWFIGRHERSRGLPWRATMWVAVAEWACSAVILTLATVILVRDLQS